MLCFFCSVLPVVHSTNKQYDRDQTTLFSCIEEYSYYQCRFNIEVIRAKEKDKIIADRIKLIRLMFEIIVF